MNQDNPVILCEEDYKKLTQLLSGTANPDDMTLAHEVARAIVVKNDAHPPETIRIGSLVRVQDKTTGKEKSFQIVMPAAADIKSGKISVLTPMAAAVIGFSAGNEVNWKMPSGLKKLKIIAVNNEALQNN